MAPPGVGPPDWGYADSLGAFVASKGYPFLKPPASGAAVESFNNSANR
jgi:hypothetical protein